MDPIDQLPPDQSAVLSLLLRQGRSYADIAELLGIPQSSVRDRAHAALDAIAGGPAAVPAPTEAQSAATLATPGRRSGASASASAAPSHRVGPSAATRSRTPSSARPAAGSPLSRSPRSRRAGALLLAAIVAAVIVVVVLIANSGGSSSHSNAGASSNTTSASSTTTSGSSKASSGPHVDKQLNLTAPDPSSSAVGLVEIVSEGSKRAFLLSAEHFPPTTAGFFYAAWLSNSSSDNVLLGRAPSVSSNGKLQAVGALPTNAGSFHTMLITRETSTHPKSPGPIVLSGAFSLG